MITWLISPPPLPVRLPLPAILDNLGILVFRFSSYRSLEYLNLDDYKLIYGVTVYYKGGVEDWFSAFVPENTVVSAEIGDLLWYYADALLAVDDFKCQGIAEYNPFDY